VAEAPFWGARERLRLTAQPDKKNNMKTQNNNNIEVGRYLVSPMTQVRDDGGFDAVVSIRSGQGMASVDRVMHFTPCFGSRQAALRYARAQGLAWAHCH
jgi:hypothetical protein